MWVKLACHECFISLSTILFTQKHRYMRKLIVLFIIGIIATAGCKEEPITYSSDFDISINKDSTRIYIDTIRFRLKNIPVNEIKELMIYEEDSTYFTADNQEKLQADSLFFILYATGNHAISFALKNHHNLTTTQIKKIYSTQYKLHDLFVIVDSADFIVDTTKNTAYFKNNNTIKCQLICDKGDVAYKDSLIYVNATVNSKTEIIDSLFITDTIAHFSYPITDTSYSYSFSFTLKDKYNKQVTKKIIVKSIE